MKARKDLLKRLMVLVLVATMAFGLIAGGLPQAVKAESSYIVNLANQDGVTAEVSDQEADHWGADKAIDGIVNRDAAKADQSRWSTEVGTEAKWLKVDLRSIQTFHTVVLEWERTNITSYKIQTSEDGKTWTDVYTKPGAEDITRVTETIVLEEPARGRYVRLYVDGYNGGTIDWASVSLYEMELLTDPVNLSLNATTSADGQETNDFTADNATDGNHTTRWASPAVNEPHYLVLNYGEEKTIKTINIHWERTNATSYRIEKSADGGNWETVVEFDTNPSDWYQTIVLDKAITTEYLRLYIAAYENSGPDENGKDVNWPTISVFELETYAFELTEVAGTSPADIADSLDAPTVNDQVTALVLPEVPDGAALEVLADYEQIVGRDGTIYQPLTDKTVKIIYKVTVDGVSAEGSVEHTLTIPGKHTTEGVNGKPTVIPALAEWYGGETDGVFTISAGTGIVGEAFPEAAAALAEDYALAMGVELKGNTNTITFQKVTDQGLGEEGYIMEIAEDGITVKAEEATGAYWATRSILQIAELNNGQIPYGTTKDYPKYEVRGFMLDVARKPISLEMVQDIAKAMAYYKMNDFHLHLNDNLIFYEDYDSAADARDNAYTGFRLESSIVEGGNDGLNQADLTNKDLYYSKADFRELIENCRDMGVNITPEFDTPGHSGAFTKVRPDLMLQNVVSGAANRAGEQFDLTPEKYDDTMDFVTSLWDEYLVEDMFDDSMVVHIGTDEYYGEKNRFRIYSDDLIQHVKSKGYTVRLWGSLSSMPGEHEVDGTGVQLNVWNTGWANPKAMYNDGFQLINTVDGSLYIVPAAGYYFDYLNTKNLYNNFQPNNIGGTVIPAGSDQMLGSTYAIWNDSIDTRANGISEIDIYDRFVDALPTLASKNWGDTDLSYEEMEQTVDQLGDVPGTNPYKNAQADDNGNYLDYDFADQDTGALVLEGGESYFETTIDRIAVGSSLSFDITLSEPAEPGQILFEADNLGSNDDYAHDIRIMDDGRLGFRRELYDYYFDYKLPVGETVRLTISTSGTKTTLIVDGVEYPAVGTYRNRQTDGEIRVEDISIATLQIPLQRIGSKTNAIKGTIDNVVVTDTKDAFPKTGWTLISTNSETVYTTTEGEAEFAWDGNTGSIWHSDWQDGTDKLKPQGTFDEIYVEIDFNDTYTISQFSFLPRQDGQASGLITKADLYVKNTVGGEWKLVAEDVTFAADDSKKSINFEEQEVACVKFVAKASNDGWVAVSEFSVGTAVPPASYNVYVQAGNGGTVTGGQTDVITGTEVTVTATANEGYEFVAWYDAVTGEMVSEEAAYTFTVTGNVALEARFAEKHEHTWDEGEVTKDATCTEKGEMTYTCTKCGETKTEDIDPLGHDYKSVVTEPTCTEQGYTTHTCSRCQHSYVDSYTDATDHTYENGVCTGCGAEDPDYEAPTQPSEPSTEPTDPSIPGTGDSSLIPMLLLVIVLAATATVLVLRKRSWIK